LRQLITEVSKKGTKKERSRKHRVEEKNRCRKVVVAKDGTTSVRTSLEHQGMDPTGRGSEKGCRKDQAQKQKIGFGRKKGRDQRRDGDC